MSVNITTLLNGPRHVVLHVYLESEGQELTHELLWDPMVDQNLSERSNSPKYVIENILFSFAGFDARLEFDDGYPNAIPMWVMAEGSESKFDFREVGGLKDRSGMDGSGKIYLTTTGFADGFGIDQGSIVLKIRKG